MNQVGDGPEGQPTEGVTSLDSLAALMDEGGTDEGALDESGDSEDTDESEDGGASDGEQDGEEDGEGEESSEAAKLKFTIKHDGKDVELELTPDEHATMLQQSFDYTKKTMAVAEERKAVESARATAEQYRQHHEQVLGEQLSRLQALEQFYQHQLGDPPPVEWAQQDAAYFLAQKELYENRKGQLEQARTAVEKLQGETQRQRQAWIVQQADATEKALRDTLPGWNDDTLPALAKYAEGLGLTADKVDVAFVQEGFWKALDKAKAYDELMAKKAQMKPIAQLPKVAKPGTTNPQPPQLARRQEAMKAHKANPSLKSLADLL